MPWFLNWKVYVAILAAAAIGASSMFFWRVGKEVAIKLEARNEGYNLGVDESFEQFQKGHKVAQKFEKKKAAGQAYFPGIQLKLETLHEAQPVPPVCDVAPDRLRLLNSALAGSDAGSKPDAAVPAPDVAGGRQADDVRPHDGGERAPSP
jgi:hypothetical protein